MELWVLIPVSVIFLLALFAGFREVVRRRVWCPRDKTYAEVDVVQRYDHPERPVRIERCNLLADPDNVDCMQACIR
jgi:hypothetical protein